MRRAAHPGPAADDRLDLVAVEGQAVEFDLPAGATLQDAVARGMAAADATCGYLELAGAEVSHLDYVIPAEAPDDLHVAWYSPVISLGCPGRIERLALIVGRHDGRIFLHGHGRWAARGGAAALGHILAEACVLAAPARARGVAVRGAGFERRTDPETRFELFQTGGAGIAAGDHALLRIRPNVDFATALEAARDRLGWGGARAFGLGSLNCADFADGRHLASLATEFYLLDAPLGPAAPAPEIDIVGTDGAPTRGHLARGTNPVLVTAEILLRRTS
jgi:hypothetical protein